MPSLAFRKASICSRFSFSASCTLVVNPQHATCSRLILCWNRPPPSGSSCIGKDSGLTLFSRVSTVESHPVNQLGPGLFLANSCSRVPSSHRRNWEAGVKPALPRNCKRVFGGSATVPTGRPPPSSAMQIATRKPGDRRELRGPGARRLCVRWGCPDHQPLSRVKEECHVQRSSLDHCLWISHSAAVLHSRPRIRFQSISGKPCRRARLRCGGQLVSHRRQRRRRSATHS